MSLVLLDVASIEYENFSAARLLIFKINCYLVKKFLTIPTAN